MAAPPGRYRLPNFAKKKYSPDFTCSYTLLSILRIVKTFPQPVRQKFTYFAGKYIDTHNQIDYRCLWAHKRSSPHEIPMAYGCYRSCHNWLAGIHAAPTAACQCDKNRGFAPNRTIRRTVMTTLMRSQKCCTRDVRFGERRLPWRRAIRALRCVSHE